MGKGEWQSERKNKRAGGSTKKWLQIDSTRGKSTRWCIISLTWIKHSRLLGRYCFHFHLEQMAPCTQDMKKHLSTMQNEKTPPCSWGSTSGVFRAKIRFFLLRFLKQMDEGKLLLLCRRRLFKLSRCHVNPLGGWEREKEQTACGESKNKRAAGSSRGSRCYKS